MSRHITAAGVLLALLALPVGAADDDTAARQALQQRLRLTASLLADGSSAQRIVASADPRARAHLDEGKVHHALAVDLLAGGDLAGARREADQALRHLGQARRLVPDSPARQAAARARFEQMQHSLDRLLHAWQQRLGAQSDLPGDDGDLLAASGLMQTGRAFGGEQRFEEAVHTLRLAESHVLSGMNRLLQSRTLDYTARAANVAEEFELEMARHRGLSDLVPLALDDLRPTAEARALVERYAEASGALRNQAQQRFAAGDTQQALAHVRNALLYVQRALASAGLVVPQAVGSAP